MIHAFFTMESMHTTAFKYAAREGPLGARGDSHLPLASLEPSLEVLFLPLKMTGIFGLIAIKHPANI